MHDPLIGMPGLDEAVAELAARFDLKHREKLGWLIDRLFGYSCRDQEERWVGPAAMAARRLEGYRLAKAMRDDAATMLAALERIHASLGRFNGEVVRDFPPLLEAIFDVSTGGPENLLFPPEIAVLHTFFPIDYELESGVTAIAGGSDPVDSEVARPDTALWDNAAARLADLAALPIRERLPRGPVPNATLRKAVNDCRTYWSRVEGRSWTMSALKAKEVRHENAAANLVGSCEQFVAAALTAAGITFNLADLSSTWTAVDTAEAEWLR